jgi:hypothetical protein
MILFLLRKQTFSAYAYVRAVHAGNRYLKRAIQTIKRNNIRFVSTSRRDYIPSEPNPNIDPPLPEIESLEIVQERCLLLGEIVYVGVLFYMIGQPTVKLDSVLDDYFLSQLPVGSLDSAKDFNVVFFSPRLPVDDVSRCLHARGSINGNLP